MCCVVCIVLEVEYKNWFLEQQFYYDFIIKGIEDDFFVVEIVEEEVEFIDVSLIQEEVFEGDGFVE